MRWIWEPASLLDAEIWCRDRFWDAKCYEVIFEILIFRNFSGGQSLKFCQNDENLNFNPLKNSKKLKFQKSPHNVFVSPQNLSANQIS